MNRVSARLLILALAAIPLGGCLTISWQDESSATTASAAPSATAAAPSAATPGRVLCDYPHGWNSTAASRDIYGYPKEDLCEKSTQ
jgi:hypothetical protein